MADPAKANPAQAEEIERRLAKLRAETSPVFTQKEIEERLARLANREPSYYSSSDPPIKIYQLISRQQRMTDTEKTDALMGQLLSELNIDEEYAKDGTAIDAEIERRLAMLRGTGGAAPVAPDVDQMLLNSRPKGHRELIAQILSQPETTAMSEGESDHGTTSEDDDLEWCITCNEDAAVRCLDCDDDLYCRECFRDLHQDSDMRRHRTTPYQRRTSTTTKGKKKS